jgi:hypothetical protein
LRETGLEDKIKVYISSLKGISTLDYVDKDSMGHPCVTSRHGKNIFSGFQHLPVGSWDEYLLEDQRKTVNIVREFCQENELEYEILDITNLGFTSKMKLVFKGIKAPTITFKGKKIEGIPTKEDLKVLIAKEDMT